MRMIPIQRDKRVGVITALSIFAVLLLFFFLVKGDYIYWCGAILFAIAAAASCLAIQKRSIHSFHKWQVTLIVSVSAALYITLYYLTGLEYGFALSANGAISLISFLQRVIPIILMVIFSEILRDVLLAVRTPAVVPIAYAIGVLSDIICAGGIISIRSSYHLADVFGITIFPTLTANLLFVYLSKRYGKAPNIAYRLLMTLYTCVIPAISNIPRALHAFTLLILPLILYAFISVLYEKKNRKMKQRGKAIPVILSSVSIVLMLGYIMLITCQFRFGMVVIATESMTGEINKGDAVVYETYEHYGEIKEGDVILFEDNNRRVVHRVVKIVTVNGQRQYITQGDANEDVDTGYRTDAHIVGVVHFKILYIGYPSIWLHDILN